MVIFTKQLAISFSSFRNSSHLTSFRILTTTWFLSSRSWSQKVRFVKSSVSSEILNLVFRLSFVSHSVSVCNCLPSFSRWTNSFPFGFNLEEQRQVALSHISRYSQRIYKIGVSAVYWWSIASHSSNHWYINNHHCFKRRLNYMAAVIANSLSTLG